MVMYDPKEVLEICEQTVAQYNLTEVAKMLIKEGHWENTCRVAIVPFVECAETALPEFAQRVIYLEKENAELQAVADVGRAFVETITSHRRIWGWK